MEQMIIALSFLSLTTSISYSFHPNNDSSIKISLVGDSSNPLLTIVMNSPSSLATPPPLPPSVNEGLMITGYLINVAISNASLRLLASPDLATSILMSCMACLNNSLSSAVSIAVLVAPISSTLCSSRIPLDARSKAVFKPVWPPIVGNRALGFSFIIIFSIVFQLIGSI